MSQPSLLFPRRRQRRHVTKQRQRQRHNDNDTTSQDKRQQQQHLIGMEGPGGEGGYGQVVGPNDTRSRCLGQVCLIFLSSFVFTNIYLLFMRQQAHGPTLASKASRWAALQLMNHTLATSASRWGFLLLFNIRTHPRCKRESVGRFYAHKPHPRYNRESVGS
jgi:hypothetical protein